MARGKYAEAAGPLGLLNGLRGGKDLQTLGSLVTALAGAGRREEARTYARAMARRFPKEERATLLLGDLSAQLAGESGKAEDWSEAQSAYRKAFGLNMNNVRAALAAGASAERAGDAAGARGIYRRLAARDPKSAYARLAAGKVHLLDHLYPQAQAALEAAFLAERTAGSDPEFLVPLGEALLMQGAQNDDRAQEYFRAAVAVDPSCDRARRALALLHLRAGRLSDASVQLRALLALQQSDTDARRRLAEVLERAGKPDLAAQQWERLARMRSTDPAPLVSLAALRRGQGRWAEARSAAEGAVRRDPKGEAARRELDAILGSRKEGAVPPPK